MKEKKIATEIIAVSVGPKACTETLRTALAMGADKGIHVQTDLRHDQDLQPLAVAKILEFIAKRDAADMIIVGKQSIDADSCQTGQMTAGLLGWSQCAFGASFTVGDDKKVRVLFCFVSYFVLPVYHTTTYANQIAWE